MKLSTDGSNMTTLECYILTFPCTLPHEAILSVKEYSKCIDSRCYGMYTSQKKVLLVIISPLYL